MNSSTTQFWIQQQTRKVESQAIMNRNRVIQAKTFGDVIRLAQITIPPEIRCLKNTIPGVRSLHNAIEVKIAELLESRLADLAKIEVLTELQAGHARLMQDCRLLRGDYGHFYSIAERRGSLLRFKLESVQAI